jgi:tetratricopeptide (TPR) repeat protein
MQKCFRRTVDRNSLPATANAETSIGAVLDQGGKRMHTTPRSVCLTAFFAAVASFAAGPASAAVEVFGTGMAHICSDAAHHLPQSQQGEQRAIEACDFAINSEDLSTHDLTGSHINRGVLLVSRGDYAAAKQDFDVAVSLMPTLGEAYADRGAALLGLRRYADAIAEIDHGLSLNTTEPEKAYFNRAVADEALDDIQGAYRDYLHAAQLKPDWPQPRDELTRFTVATAGT